MVKYTVPCVISMVVAALYNSVDQIFIANADYLGSYENAANTVVFPMTIVAIAVMIGDGCCIFVSIRLGAGESAQAKQGISSSILAQAMNPIIRSDGSPRYAMGTLAIGAIFNIVFDPICSYLLHWGMMGAASSVFCRWPV